MLYGRKNDKAICTSHSAFASSRQSKIMARITNGSKGKLPEKSGDRIGCLFGKNSALFCLLAQLLQKADVVANDRGNPTSRCSLATARDACNRNHRADASATLMPALRKRDPATRRIFSFRHPRCHEAKMRNGTCCYSPVMTKFFCCRTSKTRAMLSRRKASAVGTVGAPGECL